MIKNILKTGHLLFSILGLFLTLFFIFNSGIILAQTSVNLNKTDLEVELTELQKKIDEYELELSKTTKQKNTLINTIQKLKTEQNKLRLQIQQTGIKITEISKNIEKTNTSIKEVKTKEILLKEQISELLRLLNSENTNTIMILASSNNLTDVFESIFYTEKITNNISTLAEEARKTKNKLTEIQNQYEEQKSSAADLLKIKKIQENNLLSSLNTHDGLLKKTKGLESNYKSIIADQKKRASEIRNRLYELFNTGKQITFGEALEIANWTNKLTGIRPAFVMAVLTQESNLGKNVGKCNRAEDPPEKSWRVIMKPERDHEPYLKITEELGLNPDTTPLSCPMKDSSGKQFGWGGAMGPAQFIPSTWMGYKNKVSALTGKKIANPWDIRDAFVAAAIKLTNDGANGNEQGEWKAAMRYFSGGTNTKFRFYGDNVLKIARQYEEDIKELKN